MTTGAAPFGCCRLAQGSVSKLKGAERTSMSAQFARNSVLGALCGLSITLAGFLSGVLVARLLGVEGAGTVAFYVWLALFLGPVVDLGTAAAVGRYVPELLAQGEVAATRHLTAHFLRILLAALAGCFVVGVVLTFAGDLLSPALSSRIGNWISPVSLLVLAYTALYALGCFAYAHLRGHGAFGTAARFGAVSALLQLVGVSVGAVLLGTTGALIGYAAGHLLPALYALRLARGRRPLMEGLAERASRYARFAWAANIANAFVWSRIEIFFLHQSWGADDVGIFAAALALSNMAVQGPLMLTTAVLPLLASQRGRDEPEDMQRVFATGTRLLSLLVFPCCLGLAAVMPVVLPAVFGASFAGAVPAATLLVCAAAVSAASTVGTNLVLALDRNDFVFVSSVLGAGLAVVAGMTLVPAFGVMGAAAARTSIQIFLVVFGLTFIGRSLRYPAPLADLLRLLVAAVACAFVARLGIVLVPGLAGLPLAILSGMAAYVVTLRLLQAVPPGDLALIDQAASGLPAPVSRLVTRLTLFVGGPSRRSLSNA